MNFCMYIWFATTQAFHFKYNCQPYRMVLMTSNYMINLSKECEHMKMVDIVLPEILIEHIVTLSYLKF